MGLIKQSPTSAPVTASPFSMKDIEGHARTILLRAKQQADQLLAAAQAEAEAMKAAAHADGLAEGHALGVAQGLEEGRALGHEQALGEAKAELSAAAGALAAAMSHLDASRRRLEADGLRDVIELAIAIARRVTKRQGAFDPGVLAANLNEAMKLVVSAADVRVAIHPAQRATLDEALPKLSIEWPALAHVQVVEDETLAPGGCRVFTKQGMVDADLDRQLDRVVGDLLPAPT